MQRFIGYGAAILSLLATSAGATGLSAESWVSGSGTDSGRCAIAAPCATFRYAFAHTATGGAIHVATSGSYGVVTLDRAVSILAPDGVEAAINVPAGSDVLQTGVAVNAGSGSAIVLKGLHITGQSQLGNDGITVYSVGSLTVDHVVATNLLNGIEVFVGFALIKSSLFDANQIGMFVKAGADVYVGQSTFSGNVVGVTGALNSYSDNDMNGNTSCDVCGATITEVSHDQ